MRARPNHLHDPQATSTRFERARLEIAQLGLGDSAELSHALALACRISAEALPADRVGVWLLQRDRVTLRRVELYQTHAHDPGAELIAFQRGAAYLEAIGTCRVVQADDAQRDPRTSELGPAYLVPLGIGAMLDAPIFRGGKVIGVVCHEHLGGPREWRPRDTDFACSVADMLGGLFEQAARLNAEAHLARALRMEALGRLAAGVAHDMNNVLAGVRLAAEALRRDPQADPAATAAEVIAQAERGERFTRQLLVFARGAPVSPTEQDLGALVRDLAPMLEALVGERCTLQVQVPPEPVLVSVDRAQLEQVLLNLVLNARDASWPDRRGAVLVSLSRQAGADGAPEAVLSVSDDGQGMAPEVLARVFEPFFSTKPPGEGTGMGLAIVHGLVEQAGGTVEAFSVQGRGATFSVRLTCA